MDTELLRSKEKFFWRNITLVSDFQEDCWLWHGSVDNGYGSILLRIDEHGKRIRIKAHRFSYLLFVNHIPEDLYCLHRCDNKRCVNPSHLFLGTYKDNAQDMIQKGRGKDQMGYTHSPETRQKMSISLTGRTHSEETKKKISEGVLRAKSR
jgi:hypothetical protein